MFHPAASSHVLNAGDFAGAERRNSKSSPLQLTSALWQQATTRPLTPESRARSTSHSSFGISSWLNFALIVSDFPTSGRCKRRRGCRSLAHGDGRPSRSSLISIKPLGSDGASKEELINAAGVAVQGFFVACFDADSRAYAPNAADIESLQTQVYNDLAMRYGDIHNRLSLLLLAKGSADRVVGCIGLEAKRRSMFPASPEPLKLLASSGRRGPFAYMSNLAVLPEFRGLGIAKRLIAEAEQQVLSWMRLREVLLLVNEGNLAAITLYESLDYSFVFKDEWAVRAIAAQGGGGIKRVRATNLCFARTLSE